MGPDTHATRRPAAPVRQCSAENRTPAAGSSERPDSLTDASPMVTRDLRGKVARMGPTSTWTFRPRNRTRSVWIWFPSSQHPSPRRESIATATPRGAAPHPTGATSPRPRGKGHIPREIQHRGKCDPFVEPHVTVREQWSASLRAALGSSFAARTISA